MVRILSFFSTKDYENLGKVAWLECELYSLKLEGVPLNCWHPTTSMILSKWNIFCFTD